MEENNNIQQENTEKAALSKGRIFKRFISGSMLQSKWVVRQLPLVCLWALFGLSLVGCRYRVEALTKGILDANERIDLLRESRIELQKQYQETVKISQIAEMLDDSDVGITAGPPFEI